MDYNLQHHTDPSGWMYSQQDSSYRTNTNEPLQEPVAFEDFQFSFGLEPGFAMPVPLDMPPAPPSLSDSNNLMSMDYQQNDSHDFTCSTSNNPLLDENDQKAFSQFLDAFFVDKDGQMSNAEQMANQFSTMYDAPPPPLVLNDGYGANATSASETDPFRVATSMFLPKQTPKTTTISSAAQHNAEDDDEYRRSSILQSLDQQKQFHQRLNRVASVQQQQQQQQQRQQLGKESTTPTSSNRYQDSIGPNAIFLQQSNQVSAPFITKHPSTASQRYHPQQHAPYPPPERQHPSSTTSASNDSNMNGQHHAHDREYQRSSSRSLSTPTRRNKSHKELLTEEEKRNNHIASEQKRRSTIRNGFKDLTDIVPTLKNINNSKSTVLFKAVDYIKYLEKRNKNLRDKMGSLEVRIKVEGRVSDILMHSSSLQQQTQTPSMAPSQSSPTSQPSYSETDSTSPPPPPRPPLDNEASDRSHYHHFQQQRDIDSNSNSNSNDISGGGVAAALLAHKSQQQQLMALQEQLQYHQRLLTQQDDNNLTHHPQRSHQTSSLHHQHQRQQQQQQNYHSVSSSSTSSSSHSSPQSSDLYQHPPVPPPRWTYDSNARSNNTNVKMEVDNEEPLKVSA
ncbi:hypothetical protein BCR42DRAFT_495328 [Absidia repens]|uniref:BHLH domain-containing protein n=1 Tax=Absidia repens TaxID=90262 RepID=A0A1X2I543_9FUNG|nr:hypothetical protein BCR42DRAFT_495328 [Absidia repens]